MKYAEEFKKIKAKENLTEINDFLLEISKVPKKVYLTYIDYFIENLNQSDHNHIKINLVYFLGELGEQITLEDYYLQYLNTQYEQSDRWIRNEIIKSFRKIMNSRALLEENRELIEKALKEEYEPIVNNALDIIGSSHNLKIEIIKQIILLLDSSNNEIKKKVQAILKKNIDKNTSLLEILSSNHYYKSLTKSSIRSLLVFLFQSVVELEDFRNVIQKSNWEEEKKVQFLNEINTFQKILLKHV